MPPVRSRFARRARAHGDRRKIVAGPARERAATRRGGSLHPGLEGRARGVADTAGSGVRLRHRGPSRSAPGDLPAGALRCHPRDRGVARRRRRASLELPCMRVLKAREATRVVRSAGKRRLTAARDGIRGKASPRGRAATVTSLRLAERPRPDARHPGPPGGRRARGGCVSRRSAVRRLSSESISSS